MEKIEVELTPVRIVKQSKGVITLKFKIVIPKIEQSLEDDIEHIIPRHVDVKIPDEYAGWYLFSNSNVEALSDKYQVNLNEYGDRLKQILLVRDYEQDFILNVSPKPDAFTTILSTHIIETQNKYGVAEFSNVPQLYISPRGKLTTEIGQESNVLNIGKILENIVINYKGEQVGSRLDVAKIRMGYALGLEVENSDGSVVEIGVGNILGYSQVFALTVDHNNRPRSIRVLFKHNDRKFTAELWNTSMQP